MNYFKNLNDGTPYEGKLSRTVWSGGKSCDYFKGLPITIGTGNPVCLSGVYLDGTAVYLADSRNVKKEQTCSVGEQACRLGSRYLNNEQNNCAILSPPELSFF